jgi:TatD DNase family protein
MELIDSHCHLDFEDFDEDREAIIKNCSLSGITDIIVPGVSRQRWPRLIRKCAEYPILRPAIGLHPCYIEQHQPSDLVELKALCVQHAPVAIGEIGLDYFVPDLDRAKQQEFFSAQLQLARQLDLPVIIHARKSVDDVISTLRKNKFKNGGIMHAFNGSLQQAERLMDSGFLFGFGGMLTFERSNHLRRLAKDLPLDVIALETDAPDMSGKAHHGQRNSPEFLPEVVEALQEIKQLDADEITRVTTMNVRRCLKLD